MEQINLKAQNRKQILQAMNTLIENYINGNLTTARKQAKRYSQSAIRHALQDEYGYSPIKAALTAAWLKTGEGWQEACDAD